ncbi:MAG: sugar phosphate isomerase/epimerase [Caldiserica bacterium]|nr:sugar phosphate isomerase/epimerase [Caldisericota bacterium]
MPPAINFEPEIGIASFICYNERLLSCLEDFSEVGFKCLELWGIPAFGHPLHFPYQNRRYIQRFASLIEKYELAPYAIHTPIHPEWSISIPDEELRFLALREIKKCIESVSSLEIQIAVIHAGGPYRNENEDLQLEKTTNSLLRLLEFSYPKGIQIVVENSIPGVIGDKLEHMERLRDSLPEEIGFCIDTGHAYNTGVLASIFKALGKRIKHLHLQDTFLGKDAHLIPGEGELSWEEIMLQLREIDYSGVLLLEIRERKDAPLKEVLQRSWESANRLREMLKKKG